jgi:ABC-2 type transport system permease protein
MRFLTAAYYEFLKNAKDIKMLGILLVFPIITVYILGNAVGQFFTMDTTEKIPVGYINEDTGSIGKEFDKFMENQEIKDRLDIVVYTDKDQGQKAIDDGKIDGAIYLSKNLSESILAGHNGSISVYGKKNLELIENLTGGFITSYNSLNAVIKISGTPVTLEREGTIERIHYTKDSKMPSMVDYYSVLTLLQVLIVGAIFGVFIVARDDNSDMHIRIHSLPVSRWTLTLGKISGSTVYLFLSSIAVILFTKYVYGANWRGNSFIILGTLLVFCIISVGIGVLTGSLIKSSSVSLMVIFLLMIFFGTVSGAISPATTGGVGIISPNFHAKILIFGTIYGYSKQVMAEAGLWLGGITVLIYGIFAIMARRAKYDHI